ncbi:MAG TPA: TylF/MycF/NovP-related O-methyltransferase [Micropepsaceae bacterium]|nr:TylF/MycF/NovP-related O-methyltransferase [Micropepsaceae bacterium]
MMFYGRFPNGTEDRKFLETAIQRFRTMFSTVFADDNVILFNRTLGFRRDAKMMQAIKTNALRRQEESLLLRVNTLIWSVKQALSVEGDFVECGVFRGFCASVVADYLDFATLNREFFLYDTFEGIPPEFDSEGHDRPVLREEGLYDSVVKRFAKYRNVRIVKGLVPYSFEEASPKKIAFLHVDMNSSKSEIAALEGLFDRVVKGGVILFDDYGWTGYEAQQLAEEKWLKERGQNILELPSGQALVVKV